MKFHLKYFFLLASLLQVQLLYSQQFFGKNAAEKIQNTNFIEISKFSNAPSFVIFKESLQKDETSIKPFLKNILNADKDDDLIPYKEENDLLGFKHIRYRQTYKGYLVESGEYLVHIRNGNIESVNGLFFDNLNVAAIISIDEKNALQKALDYVGAKTYQWQNPKAEILLKQIKKDHKVTYFPKGELVICAVNNDLKKKDFRLSYKFDIYASSPMSRAYIYVDAKTGEIIHSAERIHYIDVTGTARTYYSNWQTITTDSSSSGYSLEETGRGNGLVTYDYNTLNGYTDSDNIWADTANGNNAAYDAHWATEGMYDMMLNIYGRNSYDNAGTQIISYYGAYDANAWWDGTSMTYGIGDGIDFGPFSSIDVVGHEFAHGITEYSAALVYAEEPGALNESYSDIFGTLLEHYLRPLTWDWEEGGEVVLNSNPPIRYMNNPNASFWPQPDTYLGTNWDPFQEVHTNSGVQNFWFYLLSDGGSGTNDNGDNYSVTGIGIDKAGEIAYRNLTVYLTSNSQYADARTGSIQAARDLYGDCSQEVTSVANAWHAVGVGSAISTSITADFSAPATFSCAIPTSIGFINYSNNANSFLWDFGDGTTDTTRNPVHIYNNSGIFTVKLKATGTSPCPTGSDSITKTNLITITNSGGPIPASCSPSTTYPDIEYGIFNVSLNMINNPTTSGDGYQDYSCSKQTNLVQAMQFPISIETGPYNYENVRVWIDFNNNGTFANSELVFSSNDKLQYHNGNIFIPSSSLLNIPVRMRVASDTYWSYEPSPCIEVYYGQFEDYTVTILPNTNPPVANFGVNKFITCNGSFSFTDSSSSVPTSWLWDFGDGQTSTIQNPTHTYTSLGYFTVILKVCNAFGCNSITKSSYIQVIEGIEPINASCTPTTNYPNSNYGIFNVIFNTINKSSAGGTDKYQSYVCEGRTSVVVGLTYPISITTGTMDDENVCVWIDYNNNGIFSNSELVFSSNYVRTNHNGNITIPTTAILNTALRMRVGADALWNIPSSCINVYYGQFEDYTVTIYPDNIPPIADFNFQILEECQRIVGFMDASIINPTSWNWDFGDNQGMSVSQNPYYSYDAPGNYTITLIVTNQYGSDTIFKSIEINAPNADFTMSAINNTTVSFTDITSWATSWNWEFGDGYSAAIKNPIHNYVNIGTYTVKLTTTNTSNCAASITKVISLPLIGISDNSSNEILSIFPNPTNGKIFINYAFPGTQNIHLSVQNILGENIYHESKNNIEEYKQVIDLSDAAKGIYFIRITTDEKQQTKKIIVR